MRVSGLKFGLNKPYEVAAQCDTRHLKTPSESKKIGFAKDKVSSPIQKLGDWRKVEERDRKVAGGGWMVEGKGWRVEGGR